jgi:hypothetical protein
MLISKITKAEVRTSFQVGCSRHFGNSSECHKMGNCRLILLKFDTQAKTDVLSSKITIEEVNANFQDGRRRHVGNSSEIQVCAIKWAITTRFR